MNFPFKKSDAFEPNTLSLPLNSPPLLRYLSYSSRVRFLLTDGRSWYSLLVKAFGLCRSKQTWSATQRASRTAVEPADYSWLWLERTRFDLRWVSAEWVVPGRSYYGDIVTLITVLQILAMGATSRQKQSTWWDMITGRGQLAPLCRILILISRFWSSVK
jgi:hypothetical protein